MPSLRQLQYFVALSETGHFRLAAEKTGVSQPTLSAQLLALERRLGVQLVERNRSPVILTSAGERILPIARRVALAVLEINSCAQDHLQDMSGVVRLGLPATIGPYLLPTLLPVLHRKYPLLRLHVRENLPEALPHALASGMHDLLIIPLPVRGEDFTTARIFREPLFLAVAADHALAARGAIAPTDLAGLSVLALEKGHALREQVHGICQEYGANILYDYEGTSLNTLLQMVSMGLGITFLPGLFVKKELPAESGVKILKLSGKPIQRTIGLAWRNSAPNEDTYHRIAMHLRDAVRMNFPDFMVLDG
jgi:LysR family transcriptional regulator, hydrogen peroxide-inducible genes activator